MTTIAEVFEEVTVPAPMIWKSQAALCEALGVDLSQVYLIELYPNAAVVHMYVFNDKGEVQLVRTEDGDAVRDENGRTVLAKRTIRILGER